MTDADTIVHADPAVLRVGYLTRQGGQVEYGNQNWSTNIQGVSPSYLDIVNWRIATGSTMTELQNDSAELVCLIGQTVYQNLFPFGENPVGAVILIKGVPVRVIGLLVGKGQTGYGQDQDDLVMIPFNTAERKVLGAAAPATSQNIISVNYPPPVNPFGLTPRLTGYVNSIYVQAGGPDMVATAIEQVTGTLAKRHRIQPGQLNDFSVRNLSQIAEAQAEQQPGDVGTSCHGCFHFPARRRHRNYEHPFGIRNRAHARNRHPHGDRGASVAGAAPVPARIGVVKRNRRRGGYRGGSNGVVYNFHRCSLANPGIVRGCRGRICLFRSCRNFLWLLSCPQGRQLEPDRRTSL